MLCIMIEHYDQNVIFNVTSNVTNVVDIIFEGGKNVMDVLNVTFCMLRFTLHAALCFEHHVQDITYNTTYNIINVCNVSEIENVMNYKSVQHYVRTLHTANH